MDARDKSRIEQLLGSSQPAEFNPESPTERMLAAAAPETYSGPYAAEEVVHRPWTPTGETKPQRTVEPVDLEGSPPPPLTAGGSIPSSRIPMRQFGPDSG
jgi:hypothetical protein